MSVITEEAIRQKLRKKQLVVGSTLYFLQGDIFTPSAKSYLREHQIKLEEQKQTLISKNRLLEGSQVSDQETKAQLAEVANRILHLHNQLFFPQLANQDLASQGWLYLEQQQHWLLTFRKSILTQQIQTLLPKKEEQQIVPTQIFSRIWNYYCYECYQSIEEISLLLSKKKEIISPKNLELFKEWKTLFIKNLRLESLAGLEVEL
ncbi:hypothetical protein M2139_000257 [Enterococcus sp. PF1-24]|uniref:hypothetical protein n=1 Tax=unclassified Enterococcus TaxID=2608891 RepID=UPI0024767A6A|nr:MULTISPECIES: hypothetical protein [unclassified Enterococcus]MDH6363323.1 hypothetical protein [Enterococcus sp. PFB1-1]MDH6400376.1 hypothetical protein [Enterococcus sp. PF1-24]